MSPSYCYQATTSTTTNTYTTTLILRKRIWYANNKKSEDINEILKRVLIDKSIKLGYYYTQ